MDPACILIVDDNPMGRDALEELLFGQGYTLATAEDGPSALQKAADISPDLILLDVMMPGMDGYEVCRRIRANPQLAETPVILVTALDDQASRLQGLEAGADDFISKPYNRIELRTRVKTITRLNRYRRLVMETSKRIAAENSNARLATAVEQAAESIVITDLHGTIIYVNPAFERSSGYAKSEILGRNPRFLKSGKQDAAFYRNLWETIGRGDIWHGHFSNRHKSGTLYEEDATISPIRDTSGTVVNFVAVKRDITREMQLEAQFRQSQKMEAFGLLAGGVAHDFNNILSVVNGYCELWLMKLPEDEPVCAALHLIRTAGERAASLTKQLLAFSRQTVLEPKVLDLNAVIQDTTKMLARLIGEDVELIESLDASIPPIKIDPGQISQVLINLAVNARDAMPRGGRLTISTAPVSGHVMLTVSDTGTGIAPDILPRIFEPFFTTKSVGKGTGLGLAVVHGVITQSGGSIDVTSRVGEGTTFNLHFPISTEALVPTPAPRSAISLSGHESILVVEDETALRNMIADCLHTKGYRVTAVANGPEALTTITQNNAPFDLILTDVVMPGMSGRELADAILRTHPAQKFFFMSGYIDDSILRNGIHHQHVTFLQKPFSPIDMLRKVRGVLNEVDAPNSKQT
ncbi:MAG: response regulator [Planctomycetota bacterium]